MSHILTHFTFDHLPDWLQPVSKPLCELATFYDENLPDSAEKSTGLRKLLEAKDCLVRAAIEVAMSQQDDQQEGSQA